MPLLRIFIVSAVALYREGLSVLLAQRDGIDVVGVAADTSEAAELLVGRKQPPDIVIFDMGPADSLTAARRLIDEIPRAPVVAITVPNHERDVLACAEVGLAGFVSADASLDDLVAALESVARGEMLCSPRMAAALTRRVADLARGRGRAQPLPMLTKREREILVLIDEGLSNKQIAYRLHIELATVRNHVHNILAKLGVHRRAEAAALTRAARPPNREPILVPED